MNKSMSSSIEHSEKQPPYNLAAHVHPEDKLKLDTHDTLRAGKRQFDRCSMEKTSILDAGREGSSVILIKGESEGHAGSNPVQPTLQSSDPAGLFSKDLVPSIVSLIPNSTPAVDNHVLLKSGKPRKNKFCYDSHNCTTCKYGNKSNFNLCIVCVNEECSYERL